MCLEWKCLYLFEEKKTLLNQLLIMTKSNTLLSGYKQLFIKVTNTQV